MRGVANPVMMDLVKNFFIFENYEINIISSENPTGQ